MNGRRGGPELALGVVVALGPGEQELNLHAQGPPDQLGAGGDRGLANEVAPGLHQRAGLDQHAIAKVTLRALGLGGHALNPEADRLGDRLLHGSGHQNGISSV